MRRVQTGCSIAAGDTTRDHLLAAGPSLRAFAYSLTHNPASADDRVQDTLVRAWASRDHFEPGTNLGAWVFTILRNRFYALQRRGWREVEDVEGQYASHLITLPEQEAHLGLQDLQRALMRLSPMQREVLLLVVAQGLSYEEAAQVCGCAVGSVKSRLHRTRRHLEELIAIGDRKTLAQTGSRRRSRKQLKSSTDASLRLAGSTTARRRGSWSSL